ncbi:MULTISPECIES: C39 family peptidase [unclassified Microcoleus]|uniref:C39 family peptidase n=1 Tax=unclassified Microcoleus TaxID=2642155 RepID=UPI002FD472A1
MTNIKLDVPYFSQVDNNTRYFGSGSRQCCMTSNAMAANYLLQNHKLESFAQRAKRLGLNEPESAYGEILNHYGDSTDHGANTEALKAFKLESYFSTSLTIENLIYSLERSVPVPAGLHYKSSGHIVCVVGVDTDKEFFWVHDPYGVRAGIADYYEAIGGQSGRYDKYSFEIMENLWTARSDGWGRIFTNVGGKSTGL